MSSAVDFLALVEKLLHQWGIFIVPIGAFLENSVILGFIFPGVTLIFLSGFVARTTGESVWLIIFLAAIGSFLGDNLDYLIGRRAGKILENKPLFEKPIRAVEPFLKKHGIWAIFAGRFSGWSRAWVALASGIVKFPYWKFAVASATSAIVWTSAWIIGGFLLGANRDLIEDWFEKASILVWLTLVGIIVYYFRTRIKLVLDLIAFTGRKYGNKLKSNLGKGNHEDQQTSL